MITLASPRCCLQVLARAYVDRPVPRHDVGEVLRLGQWGRARACQLTCRLPEECRLHPRGGPPKPAVLIIFHYFASRIPFCNICLKQLNRSCKHAGRAKLADGASALVDSPPSLPPDRVFTICDLDGVDSRLKDGVDSQPWVDQCLSPANFHNFFSKSHFTLIHSIQLMYKIIWWNWGFPSQQHWEFVTYQITYLDKSCFCKRPNITCSTNFSSTTYSNTSWPALHTQQVSSIQGISDNWTSRP